MPSSNKTANLSLNKWLGSDKPKKDDFVADNEMIDQAVAALRTQISGVQQSQTQLSQAVAESIGEVAMDMGDMQNDMAANFRRVDNALSAHTGSGAVHVTQAQKNKWDQQAAEVGTFTGNGAASQKVSLGYAPRAGFVFAMGVPAIRAVWANQSCEVYSAFFSASGSGGGAAAASDGFTVQQTVSGLDGMSYSLNAGGQPYVYAVWR